MGHVRYANAYLIRFWIGIFMQGMIKSAFCNICLGKNILSIALAGLRPHPSRFTDGSVSSVRGRKEQFTHLICLFALLVCRRPCRYKFPARFFHLQTTAFHPDLFTIPTPLDHYKRNFIFILHRELSIWICDTQLWNITSAVI